MLPAGIRSGRVPPLRPIGKAGSTLTVNLAAVLHADDQDDQPVIVELADKPEIPYSETAKSGETAESRFGKAPEVGMNLLPLVDVF